MDHLEKFILIHNNGEFLFSFVLFFGYDGHISNKLGETVNCCVECEVSTFAKCLLIMLYPHMSFVDFFARLFTQCWHFVYLGEFLFCQFCKQTSFFYIIMPYKNRRLNKTFAFVSFFTSASQFLELFCPNDFKIFQHNAFRF